MPTRATVPNPPSHPSRPAYPAGLTGNSFTPSSPPMGSSAAATCMSAWVSTPPVTARASTMVNAIPFLWLKGWHAPAGRRTREPRPLAQDGQIGTAPPVGAKKTWDPADESLAGQPGRASADSEVRPGPRPPTLRPYSVKTGEAGPEALPTSSLPTLYAWLCSELR